MALSVGIDKDKPDACSTFANRFQIAAQQWKGILGQFSGFPTQLFVLVKDPNRLPFKFFTKEVRESAEDVHIGSMSQVLVLGTINEGNRVSVKQPW